MKSKATSRTRGAFARYVRRALELGAAGAKIIRPSGVVCAEWVRLKCEFGCDGFGTCHTCPPRSPTPDRTRRALDGYRHLLLVHTKRWRAVTPLVVRLEREIFLDGWYKAFAWGAGPCRLCKECDVTAPCEHRERVRPAMEGSGIDVYATARRAGFPIAVVRSRDDDDNYYGLVGID
jgi:predicted metal-binding protein